MSELFETLREAIAALDAADPGRRRFGAAQHGYRLLPPRSAPPALPDDLRAYVTGFSAGGAGPYYGLVPPDVAGTIDGPYGRGVPLAHLGCGYLAVVALDDGAVWVDARALEICAPIASSATAFVLDWVDRVARSTWLDPHVPPGRCPLAAALSGYLAHCEAALGLSEGSLAGDALRDALGQLAPGSIVVAATSAEPWFSDGDPVDPCVACAQLLDNLGLSLDVVAPGTRPRPLRNRDVT